MVAINENFGKGDPELARLCVLAYHGDNNAMSKLEEYAMAGNTDALNLMKIANMPSCPALAEDFVRRYRDMLEDILERFGE